jgi:hypothetical protein
VLSQFFFFFFCKGWFTCELVCFLFLAAHMFRSSAYAYAAC